MKLRRSKLNKSLILFLSSTLAVSGSVANATDFLWKRPVSGIVTGFANWNPAGLPGSADTAIFNLGSTGYTVSFPPDSGYGTVGYVQVGNDTITVNLDKNTLALAGPNFPDISLGNASGDVANLTLENGTLQPYYNGTSSGSGADAIGYAAGSTATATIDGSAGPVLWSDSTQYVGYAGTGTVAVVNGGQVEPATAYLGFQAGTQGTVTVTGTGSAYSPGSMAVGESGMGNVSVTAGGKVSGNITVGDLTGSHGMITVTGTGSTLDGYLVVGNSGTGSLSVSAGATASGGIVVGNQAGSQGTVTIAGTASTFAAAGGDVIIGNGGIGSFSMTGGATGTGAARDFTVGYQPRSQGMATLDGAGTSLTVTDSVLVAGDGSGSLSLTNGAKFTGGEMTLGSQRDSSSTPVGSVTVDGTGSHLSVGSLTIGDVQTGTESVTVQKGGSLGVGGNLQLNVYGTETSSVTFDGLGTTGNVQGTTTIEPLATVTIRNGAALTTAGTTIYSIAGLIGTTNPGQVIVDGTGSQWNVTSLQLYGGTVSITNGAAVDAQSITYPYSSGTISVGSGSALTASSSISVGGLLTVGAGSAVTTPSLQIGRSGTIDLSGGGTVTVGTLPPAGMGQSLPAPGSQTSPGTIQLNAGGMLQSNVGGDILGSVLNNGGEFSVVADSPAVPLHISGDYAQQAGGTLQMELAGAPYNVSGQLTVDGNVSLSGVLDLGVLFPTIYPLQVGHTYDLISVGGNFSTSGLTIEFTGELGSTVPAGITYTTQFSDGVYSLTILSTPEPGGFALGIGAVVGLLIWSRRAIRERKITS
jgi:T5SS/PEP-CTERM-associated repeat protein